MSKNTTSGSKVGVGQNPGNKGGISSSRPSNGFPGGNWPSTTGKPSGTGRGDASGKS